MPQFSPFKIQIPQTDILSYLFPPSSSPSDKPIYIDANDTKHSLNPRQVQVWVKRLGMGLQRLGVGEGDVVLMFAKNSIFVPVVYLGVGGAGAVFSGLNTGFGVEETAHQIQNTQCKVILVEPGLLPTLLSAASKTRFPRDRIFAFSDRETGTIDGIKDWRAFLPSESASESWKWRTLDEQGSRTTVAALNYSSGTTGLPKGVKISHQNVIANTEQSIYMRDLEQAYTASTRPEERWLGFLPLYHAYGQLWSIVAALRTQSPCFFMREFNYTKFLENIQRHRITHIQTAPPVLVMLAKRPETRAHDLSSLQNILCGAAPLSKDLQNQVSELLGVKVVQTWGMTELTCSSLHVPGGLDDRSGSVGFIDPNCSVKLIADDGTEVSQPGERGEIYVKGPSVCLGYWRNEAATRETFDGEGYLRTGDVGVFDEKGWFWIVDRKKELIKVKGFQVPPAELEAVLLGHEGVGDAAVCALQLDHEELPRAYIALKPGYESLSEWDVEQWMAQRVAKHKQLTGGVVFVDEVPKSPSGKIQRKILREWAKKDVEKFVKRRQGSKL